MQEPGNPNPREVQALIALFNEGSYVEAAAKAEIITKQFPHHAFGWKVLGAALKKLDQEEEALAPMQKAVDLAPENAEAHNNLGALLRDLGRREEAVVCSQRALKLKPNFAEAHLNLANALTDLGKFTEGVASYRRALEIRPDYATAHSGLGDALTRLGRFEEAIVSCRRAIEINPEDVWANFNLGVALHSQGRIDDSVVCYRRAIEIKPDCLEAYSNLLFVRTYQPSQSAASLSPEVGRFGDLVAQKARPYADWPNLPSPDQRLRVGFVSGDFGSHPVGYFLESILPAVIKRGGSRLEFFAYASHVRNDAVSDRIKSCCRGWRVAVKLTDEELARSIHEDGINVLIDLSGHSAYNRLPVFAWKPAPVQATWLGYLATTGVTAIDYVIGDPWTLPKSEAANFTEEIWHLPETYLCFQPNINLPVLAPPAVANGFVTFGCFNNLAKITDSVVALWAGILREVPQSRLFLKTSQLAQKASQKFISDRFAAHGIDPKRLTLEGPSPRIELLSTYHKVDIALDPFPYPGITTTIEALWMGVPVLTMAGERFLSRQGIGIMMNSGLPQWIAHGVEDYASKAVAHARDLEALIRLRAGLRKQLATSPLMDAPRFADRFEAAVHDMWTSWCNSRAGDRVADDA
jgi:protein O-GlcNAc transferase